MKKVIYLVLCGMSLITLCSCQEGTREEMTPVSSISEPANIGSHGSLADLLGDNMGTDSEGMYFTRYYSLGEFSSIIEGESTRENLLALFPEDSFLELQGGQHSTIVFPLEDGRTIGFRIGSDDRVVKITFDEDPIRVIKD